MPAAPLKYCARCQGVCTGACKNEASREYDKGRRDDPFKALRNTARWRALRLFIKLRDVLCKKCGHQVIKEIDHIVPARLWVAQGGDFFDKSNLQGLCKSCHSIKTRKENVQ